MDWRVGGGADCSARVGSTGKGAPRLGLEWSAAWACLGVNGAPEAA